MLALLGVLSVARLLITAFGYGIPAWFDEELNPLIGLLTRGQPIAQIDAAPVRRGRVPGVRSRAARCSARRNLAALATYAAWVALLATVVAFALAARRYAARRARARCWSWCSPGRARCRCCT